MTEQMTGRKGTAGPESPAGSPAPPASAVPSPRDLAARSPHRDAARAADHSHAEAPAPAEHGPAEHAGQPEPGSAEPAPGPARAGRAAAGDGTSPSRVRATGAQALVYALERVGADVVFGIPGGAVLPAYDPLLDSKIIRHILVRHEQGAGHAATGYAQATGRVGVCMATSGPGATNLVTPIADAYMDSVPIVAITGQVPSKLIGTDSFQEADISGITIPITKHNFLVTKPEDIARTIGEAFHVASTGRPGPVLVDISKDALQATTDFSWPVPVRAARLSPGDQAARPAGARGRAADHRVPAPGAVRRRRRDQGPRRRPAARAGRADRHPGGHHADGQGGVPRPAPAAHGHARHARLRDGGRRAAAGRPAHRAGHQVRRPGDRQAGHVRARRADRARGHRPGRDLQEPPGRRADRGRLPGGDRRPGRGGPGRARAGPPARPGRLEGPARFLADDLPARLRRAGRRVPSRRST